LTLVSEHHSYANHLLRFKFSEMASLTAMLRGHNYCIIWPEGQPGDCPYAHLSFYDGPTDYFGHWVPGVHISWKYWTALKVRDLMTHPHRGYYDGYAVSPAQKTDFYATWQFKEVDQEGWRRLPLRPKFKGVGLVRPSNSEADTYPYFYQRGALRCGAVIWTNEAWRY
jgi:hypothetical protein